MKISDIKRRYDDLVIRPLGLVIHSLRLVIRSLGLVTRCFFLPALYDRDKSQQECNTSLELRGRTEMCCLNPHKEKIRMHSGVAFNVCRKQNVCQSLFVCYFLHYKSRTHILLCRGFLKKIVIRWIWEYIFVS